MGWKPMALLAVGFAVAVLLMSAAPVCRAGVTSAFVRVDQKAVDMPLNADVFRVPPGYNAPQQVHITQGDHDGRAVIVSWVTPSEPGSSTVHYGTSAHELDRRAEGTMTKYKFYNYTSGYIHHTVLRNLK
ncbi:hypothetical protein Taro_004779, partial [Colocasia esculenta]|nr:hypothetical protein [Colocasia esculenta]